MAARQHFWAFCCYMDWDFFRIKRRFLKAAALVLQKVYEKYIDGECINAAISMPPRSGKSYLTSMFCAWWLGMLPLSSVMRNTCTAALYNKLSYDTRGIVSSPRYREVFPQIRMSKDKTNIDGWNINFAKQVSYYGAGVGGTIIGFGATLAISDDLYKSMSDALSAAISDHIKMWKQSAHDSRKELNCPEIFIGTRWSKDDVIGNAINENKVLTENNIIIAALTDEGKSFCENVKTTQEYLKIRQETDQGIWMAEYMQVPIEIDPTRILFPESELKRYKKDDFKFNPITNYSLMMIDPADTGGDDFCIVYGNVLNELFYVEEIICNNRGVEYNVPAAIDAAVKHVPTLVRIEGVGGWVQTAKDIRTGISDKNPNIQVLIFCEQMNKVEKIMSQSYFVKTRCVFRSDADEEYNRAVTRLTQYIRGKKQQHDDLADVLSNIMRYLRRNGMIT
jgi:hypothetical protein